ncbi:RNA polymerase II holoenzyme cyclin-like subunit [Scheffersomyces amazonensis]|uniref:RNA polymerase II holoenzyme cyclin-like subunit n=1 Tax=Scheffersomyces amazonensis TaxID=1078765 RepID=UPI00315C8441
MSADFWNSSQRTRWQFTRHSLLEARRKVLLLERKMIQNGLIKDYPNINYDYNMRIYLHNLLVKLGRRLNIRQVALATAEIYLTRFLTRVSLKEVNLYLLITACLYVACKIEECPQHIRLILSEARTLWPEYIPHDITKLAEFEFYLIEEMDSYLFLHHPYKSLIQIRDFLVENNSIYGFTLTDNELQNAWSLINDSYLTDLHLLVPPHIIAVAAIYITIVLKKNLSMIRGNNDTSNAGSITSGGNSNSNNASISTHTGDLNGNKSIGQNNGNSGIQGQNDRNPQGGPNDLSSMHIDDLIVLANGRDGNENNPAGSGNIAANNGVGDSSNGNNNHNDPTNNNNNNNNNPTNTNNNSDQQQTIENTNFQDQQLDEETIKINKFMNFLNHSHINLDEVVEAMQDIINVYVLWNRYNEQAIKKALQFMLLNR